MHGTDDQRPHDAQQDPGRDRVADVTAGGDSDDDETHDDEAGGDDPDPTDPDPDEVAELDPMAPGTWMFEDADGDDAIEPNEPA